eukprot:TRINITY_DN17076_c0_g2_i4.p1 TRINITY_DN17076_c0_g2~~TRINITY_DN17076_c0_g2_i4.p1  ORF type:complete len:154 (+),score=24.32 TRINITY_DN17076_c0_g2_i4:48-464(+)
MPAPEGCLTNLARRWLVKRYVVVLGQRRWSGDRPISQVRKLELAVAQSAGKNVSMDQIYKRERNRVRTEASKEEVLDFETIDAAWNLVPADRKAKVVTINSDLTARKAILQTLEETGALREIVKVQKRTAVDRSSSRP